MDLVIIAFISSTVIGAIINSIFQFTVHIHPNIHVSGSLLNDLVETLHRVSGKVTFTVDKTVSFGVIEASHNESVGIIILSVIVVKFNVGVVRAAFTVVHLLFGLMTESLEGSAVLVVTCDRVSIRQITEGTNGQGSSGLEACNLRIQICKN